MLRDALRMSPPVLLLALLYVAGVGVLATMGFASETTPLILFAAAVALPASLVAVPAYYLAYGLASMASGATSQSVGTGSCTATGECSYSGSVSGLPVWFADMTHTLGIVALVWAAVMNVVLVRLLFAARARRPKPQQPTVSRAGS